MGTIELDTVRSAVKIESIIVVYGNAASPELATQLADEIETLWNEPAARVLLQGHSYQMTFSIKGEHRPDLPELEVLQNTDPRYNYFRIEEYVEGNISFVDGLGCNSGFFKLENLYPGSTTAAHEYGHTLGLDHPTYLDIRGKGIPGIMYPRGTLVDPPFQYDPTKPAGATGGTMHPMHRRVRPEDIAALQLHRLHFVSGKAIIGDFSNIYHWPHQ